ncbi:MAG: hypothetical protein ACK5WS_04060 [Alphaproteobacteria bacterium]|jgi:orotidine-5'-phosphate decarboxylase
MSSIIKKCEDFNLSAKINKPVFFFNSMKSAAVQDIVALSRKIIDLSCIGQPKTYRKVQNGA